MANYVQAEPIATCLDCGKLFCLDCHTQCPCCHPPCSVTTVSHNSYVTDGLIEDGFGSSASAICSECGCKAVYVCRPGAIRCGVCYDNNPKEYYTGLECPVCGMDAIHNGSCLYCGGAMKTKYPSMFGLL